MGSSPAAFKTQVSYRYNPNSSAVSVRRHVQRTPSPLPRKRGNLSTQRARAIKCLKESKAHQLRKHPVNLSLAQRLEDTNSSPQSTQQVPPTVYISSDEELSVSEVSSRKSSSSTTSSASASTHLLNSKSPLPRRNPDPASIKNDAITDYALYHYRSGTNSSAADAAATSGIRHTRGSFEPTPGLESEEHRLKRLKTHDLTTQSLPAGPSAEHKSQTPVPPAKHSEQKQGSTISTVTQSFNPSSVRPWISSSPKTSDNVRPTIELGGSSLALRPSLGTGDQKSPIKAGEHEGIRRDLSVASKSEPYAEFRHAQLRASGNKIEAEASRIGQGPARPSSQISENHENKSTTSSLGPSIPLRMVELPRRNPFLWGPQHETSDDDDDDNFPRPADDIVTRKASKLTTAGESGFFDTTVETGQEATAIRVAAGAVYFRWHIIDESDLRELLVADRIRTRSPLYALIRQNCMRHQSVYQNKVMSWYLRGVSATVDAMGGLDTFTQANSETRQSIWRAFFDQDPFTMAKASMPAFHLSIDLRGIYYSDDPKALKWRRYIKTCFVWMAEDTFNYRLVNNDDESAFSNWKKMPLRRPIHELDLGETTMDVPVRHGGMYDLDRRQIGSAIINNQTYRIEDA